MSNPPQSKNLSAEEKRILLAQLLQEEAGKANCFPLSFAQQRLWFLHQLEPDSPVYNISIVLKLTGQLNVTALNQSLSEVVCRHEVLRTTFTTSNGQPVQVISPTLTLSLPVLNFQDLSKTRQEDEIQQLAHKEARRPFDLVSGPLLKATLLQLDKEEHVLLVIVHHIVFDGWSKHVFIRELFQIYEAFSTGQPSPLPQLPIQYVDFAHWQHQWLQGDVLDTQLAYWEQQLTGIPPVLELSTDRPRPPVQTYRGAIKNFQLGADLGEKLKAQSQQSKTTLFMTMLAAFAVLLARYSGQEDIAIGSPIANRNRKEIEPLIGFFVNTLVLRLDLSDKPTFWELLSRVRSVALGSYAHQDIPFEKLVDKLHPERNLSHTPLFQVMFDWQNTPQPEIELPDINVSLLEYKAPTSKFDLTLTMKEDERGLAGIWEYNIDLFETRTIEQINSHFHNLLTGLVANPKQPIGQVPLLTEAEQHQILVEWNDTQVDFPLHQCFPQLFEVQVERNPEAIAVSYKDHCLTYQELNTQANQLAHQLVSQHIGPDCVVALLAERSINFLVAMVAIFKAGGVYLPLDPSHPTERIKQVLDQSEASLVLTTRKLTLSLEDALKTTSLPKQHPQILCLEDAFWASQSTGNLSPRCQSNHLAYVIYTSGSTGQPKGAMIEHKGMLNHMYAFIQELTLTQTDVVAQNASQSFDISVWQFLTALLVGGRTHIFDREQASDPKRLLAEVIQQGVTILEVVPSLLRLMLTEIEQNSAASRLDLSGLNWLIPTGEALPPELCWQWFASYPTIPILNAYGPAECSDDVTLYRLDRPPEATVINMPVGRPVANMQLYILDTYLQPVPIGVAGELYVGGVGVGRGYLNDPNRTQAAFLPNPFVNNKNSSNPLLYKTGDLGRYLPDGNIEFLGRVDHQVKIRGFRIELGEIEVVLSQHPDVHESIVVVYEGQSNNKQLVAYVVLKNQGLEVKKPEISRRQPRQMSNTSNPQISNLQTYLKQKLPNYMVPAVFVILKNLPLTPNGKTNRNALPTPEMTRPELAETYVAPRNPAEKILAGIWTEVLGLGGVGVHDNFFELGGHSLQAVQLTSKISAETNHDVSVRTIFLHPTIATLADFLTSLSLTTSKNIYSNSVKTAISATLPSNSSLSSSSLLKIEHRPLISLFATGKISPVDSAALSYLYHTDFTDTEAIRNWFNDLPLCYRIIETTLGRIAIIQLPYFDSDLYVDQDKLANITVEALDMAQHLGADTVSLTGLIPSATDYGRAIAKTVTDRPNLPAISTGQTTTTATVVMTIKRILQEGGRDLTEERVGILGVGSIGTASLRLMIKCLPHPPEIILYDIYNKRDTLENISQELVTDYGFRGVIRIIETQVTLPPEFYDATLIIGTTNVPDILDITQVTPGTIIVDYSYPRCFEYESAIQRFQMQEDILFTEGGVLKSPHPISEVRYVPREAGKDPVLSELKTVLSKNFRHTPYHISGCVLSGLLSAYFGDLKPTVGLVNIEDSLQHYATLNQLGFQGADLRCKNYILSKERIHKFRSRFGK